MMVKIAVAVAAAADFNLQVARFLGGGGSDMNLAIKQGKKKASVLGRAFMQGNYYEHLT
jgi:hypothetical protein